MNNSDTITIECGIAGCGEPSNPNNKLPFRCDAHVGSNPTPPLPPMTVTEADVRRLAVTYGDGPDLRRAESLLTGVLRDLGIKVTCNASDGYSAAWEPEIVLDRAIPTHREQENDNELTCLIVTGAAAETPNQMVADAMRGLVAEVRKLRVVAEASVKNFEALNLACAEACGEAANFGVTWARSLLAYDNWCQVVETYRNGK